MCGGFSVNVEPFYGVDVWALWNCRTCIMSWMGPKECKWLFRCSANL
jgi:hypothetical protein